MYFKAVILQIVMLLLIVLIGLALRYKGVFNDPVTKGVNTLLLRIAWPSAILMSSQKQLAKEQIPNVMIILLLSIIIMTVSCLMVYFFFKGKVKKDQLAVFAGVSSIPNVIYVGIPVVGSMFGDQGIIYLSGAMIALNIVMWTVVHLLIVEGSQTGNVLRALINPGIAASIFAIVSIITGFRLPEPLLSLCNHLGNMTISISMILVGVRLKETIRIDQFKSGILWLSIAIRLLIIPVVVAFVLKGLGLTGMTYGVLVVAIALPAAASTQFLAEQYNKDTALAAQSTSISLLACLVTLPIVLLIAGV